jgi:hypothetical protein
MLEKFSSLTQMSVDFSCPPRYNESSRTEKDMVRIIEFSESPFGFGAKDNYGQQVFVATCEVSEDGKYDGFSFLEGDEEPMSGVFDPANYRIEVAKLMGF